ncbi:unnamed protein product [Moneuplotes crassus]|uniref:Uncharacterized protein n=1 Tax=Euplotes crassus TaxID=5936 RepID=A0AAD1UDT8_EUPCR|nr:unnamed protein product [Moneuplotes crassus]
MDLVNSDMYLAKSYAEVQPIGAYFLEETNWLKPTSPESELNSSMLGDIERLDNLDGYSFSNPDVSIKEEVNFSEENKHIDLLFGNDEEGLDLTKGDHEGLFFQHDGSTNEAPKEDDVEVPETIENSLSKDISSVSLRATCSVSESPKEEEFEIISFLKDRLEKPFYHKLYGEKKNKKGKGRPRKFKNINKDVIWTSVLDKLEKKANKRTFKQRTDAKTVSICRDTKKVFDHILKYVSSRASYKSSNIKEVIGAYAEAFTVGFIPTVFDSEAVDDKIRLFCQFIVLAYPESKVVRIISLLSEANYLSCDECTNLLHLVKIRKLPSKTNFQNIARQNTCFKNIIIKLLSKLDSINLNDAQGFRDILSDLIPEEAS